MADHRDTRKGRRAGGEDPDDLWAVDWKEPTVYKAGEGGAGRPMTRRPAGRRSRRPDSPAASGTARRSPVLALLVLVAIAIIIALAGVAAKDGGLDGSKGEAGRFELLPLTTTTTS